MFGPSVMPWQPKGIWLSPWSGQVWTSSSGEDQYRRALYTYWKRTAPYPSLLSFDGVNREVCSSRRIRTNTPLQALVTLNDSVYLDASRNFAYHMKENSKANDVEQIIKTGYQAAVNKPITQPRLQALKKLYDKAYTTFSRDADKTCEMVGLNNSNNNPATAALVLVANAILNLDEVITKN
jgi:hypothetical protein